MKYLPVIICFLLSEMLVGQKEMTLQSKPLTTKYAGNYSYGTSAEKGRVGSITIYPETDSTILFYMALNRGGPSYNMGSMVGCVQIAKDTAVYYGKMEYWDKGCRLAFKFEKDVLRVSTFTGQDECGFGNAVYADGIYKRKSNKVDEYFINLEGDTTYFKSIKW